ncbi:hypothetical protein GOBAR_AA20845 [Gossypium barbadense]|uniref:Uncharacterized protein n=1 Tax=Gossypium barbadense TaxID=3634 RepID=A0A2P5X921_GOSBA|nr:hypothetical protein GOBAR_AA20845 [Gossypium barbadense]
MVGLRYEEGCQKKLTEIKTELARVCEKMIEENEIINKQNEDLTECMAIVEAKAEGLEYELITEMENYRECHDQVDSTIKEQLRVLEDFKKKTAENVLAASPFDIRKVDFDALTGVDMSELGFDVLCPSGAVWDSFASTWNNSSDFYIKKEPNVNEDVAPTTANNNVAPSDDVDKGANVVDRDNMP